ncbi:conserved protein, unknown function [Plasmodium yoelii]|uniref:Uncharacterized protein n=3 Tax=Plasmodium yoelii TaxID=5861 RepID=A0AAE9WVC9_PLAYO|nr:conserved protein, unknown function [Plasmodium yoelii]WBY60941.1 hypothetical protein Py17XNL_001401192 [Plasmodium yoelii yoelii]CDU20701.1 conserved Plasmodium protein, unknown function [Plasmodium yoelii]VTZ81664.1 conserved protein, unknown function [Plasmodium yoelii]|eukprot:XP_725820.2 conserved protein, unknown function [Plasmodium yoelii]
MINCGSAKNNETKNERKIIHCYDIGNNSEHRKDINNLLKNIKNEEKELCFSLLNFYFLNKNFKYQNLKESLEVNNNINEYINLKLLHKDVYPPDASFNKEKLNRQKRAWEKINDLKMRGKIVEVDSRNGVVLHTLRGKHNDCERDNNRRNGGWDKGNIELPENAPDIWKKNDIVGTFNPVYNARDKIVNDNYSESIPTIDIFYNSSKLFTIQTVFEPINDYIYLLRLLPKFCLPLYDSGILQYACEDPILNPKLRGLELSYRLLIHDILFYALFSYLSDLPFWAKPPIELLRIYNYESLYSFNDYESDHTERLVFHNIKNVLYNFSDTINKIELLYPKNYYITIFPNIYFKNIIDFLKSENFKLKKIIIVVKGKNFINEQMINYFKANLENFKGITTENIKRDIRKKHYHTNKIIENYNNQQKDTKSVIQAIKKCHESNKSSSVFGKRDHCNILEKDKLKKINANDKKCENSPLNLTYENMPTNQHYKEEITEKNKINSKKIYDTNISNSKEHYTFCKKNSSSDLPNVHKINRCMDNKYYEEKRGNLINKEKEKNNDISDNCDSFESSCSENDETDDENVDGFFKTKKLKNTVYDKDNFSFSKFIGQIINYEKIIDYLKNDPQRQGENSKVRFYIKLLLFEKSNTFYDINQNEANLDRIQNPYHEINSEEEFDLIDTQADSTLMDTGIIGCNDNNILDTEKNEETIPEINNSNYKSHEGGKNCDSTKYDSEQIGLNNNCNKCSDKEERIQIEEIYNNSNKNSSDDHIGNLIKNVRETYDNNNFLSFKSNEDIEGDNNLNLDNVQDSLTRITFNFN